MGNLLFCLFKITVNICNQNEIKENSKATSFANEKEEAHCLICCIYWAAFCEKASTSERQGKTKPQIAQKLEPNPPEYTGVTTPCIIEMDKSKISE